jgi:hypothetical protein
MMQRRGAVRRGGGTVRRGRGSVRAAFDQGQVPTIACFNKATVGLGIDFNLLVRAMQRFVDEAFAPVWGTPARLVRSTGFVKGAWAMAFLDDADVANALAYHDLTPQGLPMAKVFVRTIQANQESLSVSASHELAEMLVDPAINLMSTGPDPKAAYAYETADPVESESFKVGGVPMTDFVYPAYFEGFRKAGSTRFDRLGKVRRPFQILPGGYQSVFKSGQWTEIFGSKRKERAFRKENRRGHRSTYRGKGLVKKSKAAWGKVVASYGR